MLRVENALVLMLVGIWAQQHLTLSNGGKQMIEDWTSYRYTDHKTRIFCSLLLGLIGIAASAATIYALPLEGAVKLSCGIEKLSCSTALKSDFSKIFGVPLGVFGVFYFAFWTLNLRAFQMTSNHGYICFLSWITLLGAVGSSVLAIIMLGVLQAPCLYCMITHVSNIGAFILLWPVRKWRMETPFTKEQIRHFAALTCVAFLSATTLFFANQTRHLAASLTIREGMLTKLTQSDFEGELQICESFADARKIAESSQRLVAIGFFDPG